MRVDRFLSIYSINTNLFSITPDFLSCLATWETLEPRLIISTIGLEEGPELRY